MFKSAQISGKEQFNILQSQFNLSSAEIDQLRRNPNDPATQKFAQSIKKLGREGMPPSKFKKTLKILATAAASPYLRKKLQYPDRQINEFLKDEERVAREKRAGERKEEIKERTRAYQQKLDRLKEMRKQETEYAKKKASLDEFFNRHQTPTEAETTPPERKIDNHSPFSEVKNEPEKPLPPPELPLD